MTKYVYHHIPERSGFEYIDTITLTEKGWASFEIYGCSDYILSDVMLEESLVLKAEEETVQPQEPAVDNTVEEPAGTQSGMGMLPIIVVIAIIAVCAIFFIIKKKKD